MEKPTRSPLARSFERHMRAENRSDRTIASYLHGLRQAETFLDARGTTVETATRADLEAFMADLLARRTASTAATYYKILKVLYGWLVDEEELDVDWTSAADPGIATEARSIIAFTTRQALQRALEQRSGGRLHLDPASTE
jgi:site-specific recombinase XerD